MVERHLLQVGLALWGLNNMWTLTSLAWAITHLKNRCYTYRSPKVGFVVLMNGANLRFLRSEKDLSEKIVHKGFGVLLLYEEDDVKQSDEAVMSQSNSSKSRSQMHLKIPDLI
nr:hypothetical protein Iba_chr12aCG13690 [Ipomoea batatas]GMD66587.1 hypothetical protein Iba_chr12cCG16430 [Ipomoea batatas]